MHRDPAACPTIEHRSSAFRPSIRRQCRPEVNPMHTLNVDVAIIGAGTAGMTAYRGALA